MSTTAVSNKGRCLSGTFLCRADISLCDETGVLYQGPDTLIILTFLGSLCNLIQNPFWKTKSVTEHEEVKIELNISIEIGQILERGRHRPPPFHSTLLAV